MFLSDDDNLVNIDTHYISFHEHEPLDDGSLNYHHSFGPAWIHFEGNREYFLRNEMHNEIGPAWIYMGKRIYFLNNNELSEKEWKYETGR